MLAFSSLSHHVFDGQPTAVTQETLQITVHRGPAKHPSKPGHQQHLAQTLFQSPSFSNIQHWHHDTRILKAIHSSLH